MFLLLLLSLFSSILKSSIAMSHKRVTIKDIARELKISTSTVSRALADKWDVNPDTRKAVMELSEKLHYHPNRISLSLKNQQSMAIGVIVPEFINSFFPEVIMGIESVLLPKGYLILISQSNESQENQIANIRALENKMVDGFLISVSADTNTSDFFNELVESNFPVVFFNRICPDIHSSAVLIDDRKWARTATEHLIQQGCKRIVHLAGPENLVVSSERKQGYLDALAAHHIPVDESLIIPCGILMERGVMSAYKILEMNPLPDGIFAFNDPTAIGAMKTLQKNGVKIPEDIAVVGFSESKMAVIVEPNLTSVEQPTFEIGKAAAEVLLQQLKNKNNPEERKSDRTIILGAKLNIRESSCKK